MPVKVSLNETESLIVIESSGSLLRREAGWAAERVAELLRQHAVGGILFDSTLVQKQNSPSLTGEIFSGFIQAIEFEVPIAYVRPTCWNEAYLARIEGEIEDIPVNSRVFDDIDAARVWLGDSMSCRSAPI